MKKNKLTLITYAISSALMLNGCSGGSDTPPEDPATVQDIPLIDTPVETSLDVTVIDGYIRGAIAYVDLNLNGMKDEGEPSVITSEGGRGTIVTELDIDVANAVIVVDIPAGAVDEDTITDENPEGIPVTAETAYQLVSLPGETIATPLTTLISMTASVNSTDEINAEDIQAAKEEVAAKLDLTPEQVTADYIESDNEVLAEVAAFMVKNKVIPKVVTENITPADVLIANILTDKIAEVVVDSKTGEQVNKEVLQAIVESTTETTRDFVHNNEESLRNDTADNFTEVANAIADASVKAFDELKDSVEPVTQEQLEKSKLLSQVSTTVIADLLAEDVESNEAISADKLAAATQTIEVLQEVVIKQIEENSSNDAEDNLSVDDITSIAVISGKDAFEEIEKLVERDLTEEQITEALKSITEEVDKTTDNLTETVKESEGEVVLDDLDGDGIANDIDTDIDGDGVENDTDAFVYDATESVDTDGDKIGNNADADDDGDGYLDTDEIAAGSDPLDKDALPADLDNDKISDATDTDIDGDGVENDADAFAKDASETVDTDGDKIGNNADTDDDGDGYLDADEIAAGSDPLNNELLPADLDNDKISDATDTDIDGDGVLNGADEFPTDASSWISLANLTFDDEAFAGCILNHYSETTASNKIIELDCSDSAVKDLTGVAQLSSLEVLNISNSDVADISPLIGVPSLTSLNIVSRQNDNFTDDILTDFTVIKSLPALNSITISGQKSLDRIIELGPLNNITELVLSNVGDISAISQFTALTALFISSPPIDVASEVTLDLSVLEDLPALTSLEVSYAELNDISVIADLVSLTHLNLKYNNISEISALAGLSKLTYLDLENNSLTDISALADLTKLTYLNLEDNTVTDISVLANLTALSVLNLKASEITSLTPLAGLTALTELVITASSIADYNALANLTSLIELQIFAGLTGDASVLSNLTSLEYLRFYDEEVTDISALKGLTLLTSLYINVKTANLNDLADLTLLEVLLISESQVTDLSGLSGLTNLKSLYLRDNLITDISPLASLTSLETLRLSDNDIIDISAVASLSSLSYLRIEGNEITELSPLLNLSLLSRLNLSPQYLIDFEAYDQLVKLDFLYDENGSNLLRNLIPTMFFGDLEAEMTSKSSTLVEGQIQVVDYNPGEGYLIEQVNSLSSYGTFSIDSNGKWQYLLDTTNTQVLALVDENDSISDWVKISSVGGTEYNIRVIITTQPEASDQFVKITDTTDTSYGNLRWRTAEFMMEEGKLKVSFLKQSNSKAVTGYNDITNEMDAYITLYGNGGSNSNAIIDLRIHGAYPWSDDQENGTFEVRNSDFMARGAFITPDDEWEGYQDYQESYTEGVKYALDEWHDIEISWDSSSDTNATKVSITIDGVPYGTYNSPAIDNGGDPADSDGVKTVAFRFGSSSNVMLGDKAFYIDNIELFDESISSIEPVQHDDFNNYILGSEITEDTTSPSGYQYHGSTRDVTVAVKAQVQLGSISFTDGNLATCINAQYSESTLTYAIDDLTCESADIVNLSGIEQLTGLTRLSIVGNQISDLAPLLNLNSLETLSLSTEYVSNIQSLGQMYSLTEVYDSEGSLVDFTPDTPNSPAYINGDDTGTTTNVNTAIVTGTLVVMDVDLDESSMQVQTGELAAYGTFSINAEGEWEYTLDNNNSAVAALGGLNETLSDPIDVQSFDGTSKRISITITGTISGDLDDDIANNRSSISGEIEVAGYEAVDAKAVVVTEQETNMAYGTYSITELGEWTFTLNDPLDSEVSELVGDETLLDSFSIMAADGNSVTVEISIGASEYISAVPDPLDEFEFTAGYLDNTGTERDIRYALSISGTGNLTLTNVAGAAGEAETAINLDKGMTNGGYFKYQGAEGSGLDQITGSFTTEVVLNMTTHNTLNDVSIFEFADTSDFLGWKTYIEKDDQAIRFKIYGEDINTEVKTSDASVFLTEGEWYHIVSVYDAAGGGDYGTISIYINGGLIISKELTFLPSENAFSDQATFAGSSTSSDKNLQGVMDNVALWNEALTIEQIQTRASKFDLYEFGPEIPEPLDEFTFSNGEYTNTGSAADVIWEAKSSGSALITKSTDALGNANNALHLTQAEGAYGYIKYDKVENSGMDQITGSFTTEAVIKLSTFVYAETDVNLIGFADTSSYLGFKTYIETKASDSAFMGVKFKVYGGDGVATEIKSNAAGNEELRALADDTWYHIVSVYDADATTENSADVNGTITIYINGEIVGTKAIDFPIAKNSGITDQANFLGGSSSLNKNLNGDVDNIATWNVALTEEQILVRAAQFGLY